MTLAQALKLVSALKHKQALAIIATHGYIMNDRALGRNTAYQLCKQRGFNYDSKLKSWVKR